MAPPSAVPDWLKDDRNWTLQIDVNKIDTHHHFIPDVYAKAVENMGGDPSGWKMPEWSPEATLALMDRMGIKTAILSVTSPGPCILEDPAAAARLARQSNEYGAALRDAQPERFGFFVCLPSLLDTDLALEELRYGLDVLKGDGVVLYSRYGKGNMYLGHSEFELIWKELSRRRSVVFIHPTHSADTNLVNKNLPQPVIDYPHESCRTAADMIVSGTRAKYPGCKVILSHAGGTLPYLINRLAAAVSGVPEQVIRQRGGRTYEEMMKDFRSFHFDLALSTSQPVVQMLRTLVPAKNILYGSDFPYAPPSVYPLLGNEFEQCEMGRNERDAINYGNAMDLFPRLDTRKKQAKM